MQGMFFGKWDYKPLSEKVFFDNEDFSGEHPIIKCNENELVLNINGANIYFSKIDRDKIKNDNTESGLLGTWEFKDLPYPEVSTLLKFSEPDEFSIIQIAEGVTTNLGGSWIFDKSEISLLMLGLRSGDIFKGENRVVKIDNENLELENNGTIFKGNKKTPGIIKITHLTFTGEDFFNKDGDYKYSDDEEKLPWRNWDEMKRGLLNVKHLVYNYSTLIKGTEEFETKTLTADVNATLEEEGFAIDNVFNGYDRYNLPEDAEFYTSTEYTMPLYPIEDYFFRVVGNEQITTPAGTFDCTILEGIGDSGALKKLWMINDKIGVYAKIIEEDPGETWGYYWVYELQAIN
jgi:hypothetical protein